MAPSQTKNEIPRRNVIANSLATCLAMLLMGIVLCWMGQQIGSLQTNHSGPRTYQAVRITGVGIELEFAPHKPTPPGAGGFEGTTGVDILGFRFFSAYWEWRNAGVRWETSIIGIPWWPLLAYFLFRPTFRWFCRYDQNRIRNKTIDLTHCDDCGYDLTGNVSGICPECGNRVR